MNVDKSIRVMAVASAGGHWVQLRRLRNAWQNLDVTYVSTDAELKPIIAQEAQSDGVPEPEFFAIVEANRWQKAKLLKQLFQLLVVFVRTRPDVVVTTGAALGYFALRLGKLFGARTVWIDSVANAGELSLSGKKIGKHVDLWLTQWQHLATPDGPQYLGSVL